MRLKGMSGKVIPQRLFIDEYVHEYLVRVPHQIEWKYISYKETTEPTMVVAVYKPIRQLDYENHEYEFVGVRIQ